MKESARRKRGAFVECKMWRALTSHYCERWFSYFQSAPCAHSLRSFFCCRQLIVRPRDKARTLPPRLNPKSSRLSSPQDYTTERRGRDGPEGSLGLWKRIKALRRKTKNGTKTYKTKLKRRDFDFKLFFLVKANLTSKRMVGRQNFFCFSDFLRDKLFFVVRGRYGREQNICVAEIDVSLSFLSETMKTFKRWIFGKVR